MKKLFFVVCCLFIFQSFAYAEDYSRNPTGNHWNSWAEMTKAHFINGFVNGAHSASLNIMGTMIKSGKTTEPFMFHHIFHGININQLLNGLNLLYADFKNQHIPVSFAIYVAKKQIKGTPSEDIEKILLWLRSGGKDENRADYLAVKDNEGKIIRMIEFP